MTKSTSVSTLSRTGSSLPAAPVRSEGAIESVTRVPYSIVQKPGRKANHFHVAPIANVPFAETGLPEALRGVRETDPVGVELAAKHWDLQLRTTVCQAARASLDAWQRLAARIAWTKERNALLITRIDEIEAERDAEHKAYVGARKSLCGDLAAARLALGEPAARMKLQLEPDGTFPSVPDKRLLRPLEVHAAEQSLPFDERESDHYPASWVDALLSLMVGVALGISVLAAAGIVHLDAISRNAITALIGSVIGWGVSFCAGWGVKLLWRTASETYYLKRPWWGPALAALAVTTALVAIDIAVDQRGLMAAASVHRQVDSLSGKSQNPTGGGSTTFLVAAVISVAFFVYESIIGWRRDRVAATSRVLEAKERERLARFEELREDPQWVDVLSALNRVASIEANLGRLEVEHRATLSLLDARESALRAKLEPILDSLPAEDALIIEQAISEARGQQSLSDEMLQALREGRMVAPTVARRAQRMRGTGLLERIRSFFVPRRPTAQGGA